jgi:hypothetical protein
MRINPPHQPSFRLRKPQEEKDELQRAEVEKQEMKWQDEENEMLRNALELLYTARECQLTSEEVRILCIRLTH